MPWTESCHTVSSFGINTGNIMLRDQLPLCHNASVIHYVS